MGTLKVLLVHNRYGSGSPSGENTVFDAERALLSQSGVELGTFTRDSDEIRGAGIFGKLRGGFSTPWNPFTRFELRRLVEEWHPDVVHIHNTFPLISPSIYSAISRRVAVVQTVHNFRMYCAAGVPTRAGAICTECLDRRSIVPSMLHGCYRGSRIATVPLAVNIALNRVLGTWEKHVHRFIALTEFQRNLLIGAGLSPALICVKPNFILDSSEIPLWGDRRNQVVFVGRLSEEKGILSLLCAWKLAAQRGLNIPRLCVVGDGPMRSILEAFAIGLPVEFYGQLESPAVKSIVSASKLLILPSECYEGLPMVIVEAFACGTPCAVSNLGALPSIVEDGTNGIVFEPADPDSLLCKLMDVWDSPSVLETMGANARITFDTLYSSETNISLLLNTYADAIMEWRNRGGKR